MSTEAVQAWVAAAIADGCDHRAMYPYEAKEQACRLHRDGWSVHAIARGNESDGVAAWGPDGLQVTVPYPYGWDALQAALRTCKPCGATDVDTQRYSFAGRCCAACLPDMRRQHEYEGWTR